VTDSRDKVVLALEALANEIRRPAEGVVGTTNLLLDTELTDAQREHAEVIRQRADRLLTTVNDVVDVVRIDAGTLDLEHVDFDLRIMLAGIIDGLAQRARERGLDLESSVEPEVPSLLRGDPGRLRQLLHNLVQGAIAAAGQGQVVLSTALAGEEERHVLVRFVVRCSSSAAQHDREVADLLGPLDPARIRAGLGLSIAARLAVMMGGAMELEEGAYHLTTRLERQPQPEATAAPGEIRGERVLVVSESARGRAALGRQLEAWGCVTEEAACARECLDRLRGAVEQGAPFNVALFEPVGRGLEGEALARSIKRELAIADTALVMLAAAGRRGDAARLRALGFDVFLTRPVEASHLRGCLVTLAARRQGPERSTSGIITRHSLAEERKRKVRLLLVEANHINQKVALKILRRLGYGVDAVAEGGAALEALRSTPYDVVLLDQELDGLTGEEVVRVIRDPGSDVLDHNIPVVAMAAQAVEDARKRCQAAGLDDVVTKPMHPKLLQEAIERQLPAEARSVSGPGAGQSVVIDRPKLLERLSGDELLLAEVLGEFFGAGLPLVASLRTALEHGDLVELERQAYTLKGAAANVSAEAIRGLCHKVEGAAREGQVEQAATLVDRIEHELDRLRRAMAT